MPQLPTYFNSEKVSPGPLESTAYSIERYGRIQQESIEKGGQAIAGMTEAYQKHEGRVQAAQYMNSAAQAQGDFYQQFEDLSSQKDPLDTSWTGPLIEKHSTELQTLTDNISDPDVRSAMQQHAAAMNEEFARTVHAKSINLQTEGLKSTFEDTVTRLQNLAADNPHDAPLLADMAESATVTLPGSIRGGVAQKARAGVAAGALSGMVSNLAKNPDTTSAQAQSVLDEVSKPNGFFLNNTDRKDFDSATARLTELRDTADTRRATIQAATDAHIRADQKRASEDQAGDLISKGITVRSDGSYSVNPQAMADALAIPDFETKKSTFDMLKTLHDASEKGDPIKHDQTIYDSVAARVGTDRAPTVNELTQLVGHGLTLADRNMFATMVKPPSGALPRGTGVLFTNTLNDVKVKMGATAAFGQVPDPDSLHRYTAWNAQFTRDFENGIKANKDPADLLNPDSPDYLPVLKDPQHWYGPSESRSSLTLPEAQFTVAPSTPALPTAPADRKKKLLEILNGGK